MPQTDTREQELKKEISAFIMEPKTIKLQGSNRVIEIKPLSWKKELQLIKLIGKLFEEGVSFAYLPEDFTKESFLSGSRIIGTILQFAPDILTEMAQIITDLDRQIIEEEFVFEDIVEVVFPFLLNILLKLKEVTVNKLLPSIHRITKQND